MDIKDLELLEEYVNLKKQQRELEKRIATMSEEVTALVGSGKIKGEGYTISVASRKTWMHSIEIQQLEEELSSLKKKELEEGKACLAKETFYPVIRFS